MGQTLQIKGTNYHKGLKKIKTQLNAIHRRISLNINEKSESKWTEKRQTI